MYMRLAGFITIMLLIVMNGCSFSKPAPKPDKSNFIAQDVTLEGRNVGGWTREQVQALLADTAAKSDVQVWDARFEDNTGQIIPSKTGRRLDISSTLEQVMAAKPKEQVILIYKEVAPSITTDKLKNAKRLGEFKTPILDSQQARMDNIRLTARLMNNSVISPGYTFSFNNRAGEVIPERGFQFAPIYGDNGRVEPGLGGGMCQVCTTLYNAALAAGLPILERHPHSKPVEYVQAGLDATTFTDKDLKFMNNTTSPIIIRAYVKNTQVIVDLWSL